jgi:hypothetical protein
MIILHYVQTWFLLLVFFNYSGIKIFIYIIFNHIKLIMDAMFCYNVGIDFLLINATNINNILHTLQMSQL